MSIDGLPAYSLADPRLPAPTLRRLAAEGAIATRMRVVNPTITWANHTTMTTGVRANRHGVLFNGRLLRPAPRMPLKVEHRDKDDLVRVPTVYDLAHRAGLTTAHVDWIPPQIGGTYTWAFPERPTVTGRLEREMIAAGLVRARDIEDFRESGIAWRDELWTRAATYLIWRYRPNLLYFHLLNLDSSHHQYGPRSTGGMSAIALADARVAQVLDAIDASGMRERTTLVVTSDHGFKVVKHQIRPNAALRAVGLVQLAGTEVTGCDVWVVTTGGTAMVYVTNPERRDELLAKARETLAALPGVARVIEPAEYPSLGLPRLDENDQMADLVLVARPDYAFAAAADGEPLFSFHHDAPTGTHGYPADDPEMDATFVAWGHGIRPGTRVDTIESVDVAPTVAALLGLVVPKAEGRVLREILR